jgi:hypothetical protein
MHQSQPLHFFSLTIMMPVCSDWDRAFSGQAVTHLASSQNLQARAKLNMGVMRTTRIRERMGFKLFSSFSRRASILADSATCAFAWVYGDEFSGWKF